MSKVEQKDMGRAYAVFALTCLIAVAVMGRMFMIQWAEEAEWKEMAEAFVTEYRDIEAVRGNILSDDGSLLATSVPRYDIYMDLAAEGLTDKAFAEGVDSLAFCLADMFGDDKNPRSAREYREALIEGRQAGRRYHLVHRDVDYNEVKKAKSFPIFERGRYKGGVIFEKKDKRSYPFGQLAYRTIGYLNQSGTGVGLEGAYLDELAGEDGKRLERRLIGGQWMPVHDGNDVEPVDGLDLVTSIDVNLQDVAYSALKHQLEKNEAEHGCVVLMEVETGFVKAIANLSAIHTDDGPVYRERYNHAVGELAEPGSTFKLAALLAGMEEGVVSIDDSVDTRNGKRKFFDRTMKDSNDKGYGVVTVKRAFEVSSNVGVSSVVYEGFRKEPQRFVDRLYAMGLGSPLGLEIKGEGVPLIKNTSDKTWSGVTLPWMSMGYETQITPLQTLAFYNAVANDGVFVRPQFISAKKKANEVVWEAEPVVLNHAIASKENIAHCKEMLLGVVENGTATNLRNPDYSIAGKTGTAQIAKREGAGGYGHRGERSYQASFVGYFPADNPQYSCIVVVNAPSNHIYYGNLVAGPLFKEIADKVFAKRFDLQKNQAAPSDDFVTRIPVSKDGEQQALQDVFTGLGVDFAQADPSARYVHTKTGESRVSSSPLSVREGKVPNVKGMGLRDAVKLLEDQGLVVQVQGRGFVKQQSLNPGDFVREGMHIQIDLAL